MRVQVPLIAFVSLFLLGCQNGTSERSAEEGLKSLSANDGMALDQEDYRVFIRTMPDDVINGYIGSHASIREMAIDYHSMRYIESLAEKEQLHLRDDVRGEIESAKRRILNAVYIKEKLAKVPKIEDEEILKERYVALSERLVTPEKRKVAHILISENRTCDCDNEELTYGETIQLIKKQLDEGVSFEQLARKYSADKNSSANGGLIDEWLTQKSKVDKQFLDVAFAIENVGSVSKPTETTFGTHFIKLVDIEEESLPPFEEVRSVVQSYVNRERKNSKLDEIKAKSYPALPSIQIEAIEQLIKQEKERRNEESVQ